MNKKIKKILFIESNWFFIIFLLIIPLSFFYLAYYIFGIQVFYWEGWKIFSAIALIGTFIFIGVQTYLTKKQVEYSVMPNTYFILRTSKRIFLEERFKDIPYQGRREELIQTILDKIPLNGDKLKTLFIVKNNSKYPILFKVKIDYKIDGKTVNSCDAYWKTPLHVYPSGMRYPEVINLEDAIQNIRKNNNSIQDKKIIAHIEYTYSPRFAPKMNYGTFHEEWIFNLREFRWRGPQDVKEENLI